MSPEPHDPYGELGGQITKGEAAKEKIRRDIAAREADRPVREAAAVQAEVERDRAALDARLKDARRSVEASLFHVDEKNARDKISQKRAENENRQQSGLPPLDLDI